ncbi:TetR/AcrR family transcriptional regulator [Actinophytocola gossypii]|uniref:TetR family transcriptional regulator C-terminal domain-containing protein n=1 Tax=Actinophytocola gossypii TaxID=2812003 RepID=A0ABT2JGE2_9PSEU|nr:TetR family transcriptional regulator C-terminal domain-containing protein [Actinophytocola gossypii]MCT2586941.1 TetR family transcriptional regulator C-terminal domain-containing protein [Actinophytocola gossypii]
MATEEYHAQRRNQVADAVERLVAAHGLDGVTVARTAAEAEVSVGLVQHYFASKDDMLRFAYTRVTERAMERVERQARDLAEHRSTIRAVVRQGLGERLPLDDARRAEWRVSFAFAARAVDRPDLAAVRNRTEAAIRARVAQVVENGKECGEVPEGADSEEGAAGLMAVVEGLGLHAYLEAVPADVVLGVLDRHLAEVFPGECHQYD